MKTNACIEDVHVWLLNLKFLSNIQRDEIYPSPNLGLSWTSEQAIESSHHHFAETWNRYKKTPGNKKKALLGAVSDFNYTRFLTSFSEYMIWIEIESFLCMFEWNFMFNNHTCRSSIHAFAFKYAFYVERPKIFS